MQELGCATPCNLEAVEAFANAGPLVEKVCLSAFAAEDLTSRVRFFSSALYRDFLDTRGQSLLRAAKTATSSESRLKHVSLLTTCAAGMEGETGHNLQRCASWARTLFDPNVDEVAKVEFVLADTLPDALSAASAPASAASAPVSSAAVAPGKAQDKFQFASTFQPVPGDTLTWKHWSFFVEPNECPSTLTWQEFNAMALLVKTPRAREGVRNPCVSAVLDFVADTAVGIPQKQILYAVAAKNRLCAEHWKDVSDTIELDYEEFSDSTLQRLWKALGKLWPFKMPDWACEAKNEHTRRRALRSSGKETLRASEPKKIQVEDLTGESQPMEGQTEVSGIGDAEEPEDNEDATAERGAGKRTAAPRAGKSTGAPRAEQAEPTLVVGDIVRLDRTVGKPFWDVEAQVTKIRPKTMTVVILQSKNKDVVNNFRPGQCKIVKGSTLRRSLSGGRASSAAAAPDASAAAAPDASAAPAPEAAAAGTPGSEAAQDAEEERRLIKELGLGMNSDEDDQSQFDL